MLTGHVGKVKDIEVRGNNSEGYQLGSMYRGGGWGGLELEGQRKLGWRSQGLKREAGATTGEVQARL